MRNEIFTASRSESEYTDTALAAQEGKVLRKRGDTLTMDIHPRHALLRRLQPVGYVVPRLCRIVRIDLYELLAEQGTVRFVGMRRRRDA